MTTKNPWLGLASYEEPKNDGTDYLFCGRDEETIEMVRLVENNLFVTLYGSSGIGKTSLLRAGVIPILRRKDYFPLYVRLSQESKEISYAEAIVKKLQGSGITVEQKTSEKHPDGNDRLFLWKYFATTRFLNEGCEVYPVIILDQFEELFRGGNKAKAELLLRQIYLLLNDELEMPDEVGWSSDTNYRFVASIREDFLFVLEDSIDENSLDLYKNNRYRLRPMKPEQARQVVLIPGKDCIEETASDTVSERIIKFSKRPQSNDIDTLVLSLVCAGTYEKKSGEKITLSDLAIWKNNPMEVFYKDAVKVLTTKQIRYIQQHLIRDDGSRRRVNVQEVKSKLGDATYYKLTQGVNRLFTIGEKEQVELLHDQLGMAVFEERKAYEEQEQSKRKIIWFVLILLPLLFFIIAMIVNITSDKELKRRDQIFLELQTKYVAEKVFDLVDEGDSCLAQLLSLEVLPHDSTHPERPYTIEAERALRKATMRPPVIDSGDSTLFCPDSLRINLDSSATIKIQDVVTEKKLQNLKGHKDRVTYATYSSDRKHIVSASHDNTIRVWDTATGQSLLILDGQESPVDLVMFSSDGKHILFKSHDKIIKRFYFPPLKELIEETIRQLNGRRRVLTDAEKREYYLYEENGSRNLKDNRSINEKNKEDFFLRIKR